MKVANLQLQGMLMAIASINNLLVRKGMLTIEELDTSLHRAEADLTSEERLHEDMSPSNRDAVCFPIRLLRAANKLQDEARVPSFSELARSVGETKGTHNKQL